MPLYRKTAANVRPISPAVVNADVDAAAAIAYSKLNLATSIVNADISASAAIAKSKLAALAIVDADVAAGAAIAKSKLASLAIVNADVAAGAAIAYSKLALGTSIVNADVATSAAIAYSKLALGTSIVNADIATSAAIAYSKLNLATSIVNADIATAAAIAISKLAGYPTDGTKALFGDATWKVPSVTITSSTNSLGSDVTMTTANTYYDGPSLSLAAGTWLIVGSVTVLGGSGSAGKVTAKLWDGTTVSSSGEETPTGAAAPVQIALPAIVSPGGTTTYKISATCTQASAILKAAAPDNAAGNTASTLVAIKIA